MKPPHPNKFWLIGTAVALLCTLVVAIKVHNNLSVPYFSANSSEHFYWTESAFHFRHARMVSDGDSIPVEDMQIQHPEGLRVRRYITPLMDQIYGRLHRWFFADTELHVFLIYAVSIFSTLSLLACFFAGWSLWQSPWIALICATMYSLVPASTARVTSSLNREDFALPLLFGSFACFLACMKKQRPAVVLGGAAMLIVALAGWHLSQFYFQIFVAGLALLVLIYLPESIPRATFTIYVAAVVAASMLLEVLREKAFIGSMALMMSYALLIVMWLSPGRSPRTTRWTTIGLMIVFIAGGFAIQHRTDSHSHVFATVVAKLRYLGQLPADPSLLSFEAKSMWTAGFISPNPEEILLMLGTLLLFLVVAIILWAPRLWRRQVSPEQALVLYFALITCALYLMFQRLSVFAVFYLALLPGLAWTLRFRNWRVGLTALLVICMGFEVIKLPLLRERPIRNRPTAFGRFVAEKTGLPVYRLQQHRPSLPVLSNLTRYLQDHTQDSEAVVSSFELGPSIATYANRPTVLHSSFESKSLRDKVQTVYESLFENEQTFYDLCLRYDARYVIHQANFLYGLGPGTLTYNVGRTTLPTSSALFAFHFAPHQLEYFHLVHQNKDYRIYRVGATAEHHILRRPPIWPIYDLKLFVDDKPGDELTRGQINIGMAKVFQIRSLASSANNFALRGHFKEAAQGYRSVLKLYPGHPRASFDMSQFLTMAGNYESAGEALINAIRSDRRLEPDYQTLIDEVRSDRSLDPEDPVIRREDFLITCAVAKIRDGNFAMADQLCRRAAEADPQAWGAHLYLGISLFNRGRIDEAAKSLHEAIHVNPDCHQAYEQLATIFEQRGERQQAIGALEHSLEINPKQAKVAARLQRLRQSSDP